MTPCSRGIRSSWTRAAKPPGRNDERTAAQPSRAVRRSVVAVTAMSSPRARAIFSASVRISSSRSGSRSTSTTSEPSKSCPFAMNDAIVPAPLVEPPPRYTSFIRATVASLLDRPAEHSTHEMPLKKEARDHDRQRHEPRRGSHLGGVARARGTCEEAEAERCGLVRLAARDEDQGEQELVPGVREDEHAQRQYG